SDDVREDDAPRLVLIHRSSFRELNGTGDRPYFDLAVAAPRRERVANLATHRSQSGDRMHSAWNHDRDRARDGVDPHVAGPVDANVHRTVYRRHIGFQRVGDLDAARFRRRVDAPGIVDTDPTARRHDAALRLAVVNL